MIANPSEVFLVIFDMVKHDPLFLIGIHSVKFIPGGYNTLWFLTSICVYQGHFRFIPTKGVNLAMELYVALL